jgi:hypothetical protein
MKVTRRESDSGMSFDLWANHGAWFWGLTNLRVKGRIVGAARTKAEAIREACAAIEELSGTFLVKART